MLAARITSTLLPLAESEHQAAGLHARGDDDVDDAEADHERVQGVDPQAVALRRRLIATLEAQADQRAEDAIEEQADIAPRGVRGARVPAATSTRRSTAAPSSIRPLARSCSAAARSSRIALGRRRRHRRAASR